MTSGLRTKHPKQQSGGDPDSTASGSRWSQIAAQFADAIRNGDYADGDLLPAAASVADRCGVNRHTVRQAFRHLQDLGLVTVERGRGTIVRTQRFPYRLGRRVSFRANFGAVGLDVAGTIVASRRTTADAETAERLAIAPNDEIWEIRTLNRAAGVPVSTGIHRLSVARFPEFDRRLRQAKASISGAFRGCGIDDYVRLSTRLSARTATRDESKLLELPRGAPVLGSIAIDGLEDGTVLQTVDGIFAGERVEMILDQRS